MDCGLGGFVWPRDVSFGISKQRLVLVSSRC